MTPGAPNPDVAAAERVEMGGGRTLVRLTLRWSGRAGAEHPTPALLLTGADGASRRVAALPGQGASGAGGAGDVVEWRGGFPVDAAALEGAELAVQLGEAAPIALPPLQRRDLSRPPAAAPTAAAAPPPAEPPHAESARAQRARLRQETSEATAGTLATDEGARVRAVVAEGPPALAALELRLGELQAAVERRVASAAPGGGVDPAALEEAGGFTLRARGLLRDAQRLVDRCEELGRTLGRLEPRGAGAADPAGSVRAQEDPGRLLAMEFAREGRSRTETARHLEQMFGIRLTPATLDEVFGPGS